MNMRRISAVLLLTLFGGCAPGMGTGAWVFEKPDATAAQLKRDRDECFAQSIDAGNVNRGGLALQVNREAYKACMEARGYRVRVAMTAELPDLDR